MDDHIFDIVELVSKYMTGELTGEEQKCLQNIHTGAYGNGGSVSGKERRYRRNPVPGAEEAVE